MSPLSISRLALAASAAVALTGCSAGKINYVNVDSSYDATEYSHIPFTGPIYAEVAGNPFGIPQADLQRLVNNTIQPPGAKSEYGQGVRVHFAFGETASDRHLACSAQGNQVMTGGNISMVAALCRGGDSALTYLVASVDNVNGPSDPRFESFLRQATVQLFPKNPDDNRRNEPSCFLPNC